MLQRFFILFAVIASILVLGIISCEDNPVEPKPDPTPDTVYTPEIVRIDPVNAKIGETISITGKYFRSSRGTSYVTFGTDKALSTDYLLWSDTLITMTVPVAAKTGYIKIVIDTLVSNTVYFTVGSKIDPPIISRINPDKAYPLDEVALEGTNFLNTRDTNYIMFHGSKLEEKYYGTWTSSKITFTIPEGAKVQTGQVSIKINGKESNLVNFVVKQKVIPKDPPVIASIEPNTAEAGDTILITGSFFTDFRTKNAGFVSIGGANVDDPNGYVDWKDDHILVIVPKTAKTGKLYVSKESLKSNEVDFTYGKPILPEPVIEWLSSTNLRAKQTVDLNGKNFGTSQGLSSVSIDDAKISRTSILTWSKTKITITIPEDILPGNHTVSVKVDEKESNKYAFLVIDASTNYFVETVLITKGSFMMGTDEDDMWANPKHQVTLTKDFYMSKYEISQAIWKKAASTYPDYLDEDKGDNKPATQVSWLAMVKWCNDASKKDGLQACYTINGDVVNCDFSKNGYRLPTEAEWEYACRAGSSGDVNFSGDVQNYAWMGTNSGKHLNDVGQKEPNAWGLYDMYGNASEWVWDYLENWSSDSETDPTGPSSFEGNGKVIRGGSNASTVSELNSWSRDEAGGSIIEESKDRRIGFRVVRNK